MGLPFFLLARVFFVRALSRANYALRICPSFDRGAEPRPAVVSPRRSGLRPSDRRDRERDAVRGKSLLIERPDA